MLFMIIERFRDNDMIPIYRKVREGGRSLPEGLKYIDSWVEPNFSRCFQLMECDDGSALARLSVSRGSVDQSLQPRSTGSGMAYLR